MISESRVLRKYLLPVFAHFNPGDVTITHHYTGEPFVLHSYRHKGYWYHGKRREQRSMFLFDHLVKRGDTVLEVGGHIGYVSLLFAQLVEESGHLYILEPSADNLKYLRRNIDGIRSRDRVTIIPKAAGVRNGVAPFFIEDMTGQNNTLVRDFDRFRRNQVSHHSTYAYKEVTVEVSRIDDIVNARGIVPSFVKIDVEGAEFDVLSGMAESLERFRPRLMVEIQRDGPAIWELLTAQGYKLFTDKKLQLVSLPNAQDVGQNVFCIHMKDAAGLGVMQSQLTEESGF